MGKKRRIDKDPLGLLGVRQGRGTGLPMGKRWCEKKVVSKRT